MRGWRFFARVPRWRRPGNRAGDPGERASAASDDIAAELTANYWQAYNDRMRSVGFQDMARRFPGLVGQAVRLGWAASPRDTAATIALNIASGVFAGYALFATTGVLQALFASGPTPHRVWAALPSLILVATRRRAGVLPHRPAAHHGRADRRAGRAG